MSEVRFTNRELSWLEFNQRVLDEAADETIPPLERLKFLAITAANLHEFFMVRVGGLIGLARAGAGGRDPSGRTPAEQLAAIRARVAEMNDDQYALFADLSATLAESGIRRLLPGELDERGERVIERLFENEILGVASPLAFGSVDEPLEPTPRLKPGRLHIAVRLSAAADADGGSAERFAVVPIETPAERFVTVPAGGRYAYVLLEDVVRARLGRFFGEDIVVEAKAFRAAFNADMAVREDAASDLLEAMRDVLSARNDSYCVRLEIESGASPELLGFLRDRLEVDPDDVAEVDGPVDLSSFFTVAEAGGFDQLRYPAWPPQDAPAVDPGGSIFESIASEDVLLIHPYESFDPVVRLVTEAADDPDVIAVKQILYRTSKNSPIVAALARAARNGKTVTVLVELKARFDEARNIGWAERLEQDGVRVLYGVRGLKTHAKTCLVVRRESQGVRRFVHFGTGNYNERTSRIYGDVSLLTTDEDLAADVVAFFNAITGYSEPRAYRKIAAAPHGLRPRLVELIDAATLRSRQGRPSRIRAKFNSLVDTDMIGCLYEASRAGVKIDLNIRGICCLRPGVPGLSENIRVVSVIDRYLEHARIFEFDYDGELKVFISSADWMTRNLDRRVELLVPIEKPAHVRRLGRVLDAYFTDRAKGRELTPDGGYLPPAGDAATRSQELLHFEAVEAARRAELSRPTMFDAYRAGDEA